MTRRVFCAALAAAPLARPAGAAEGALTAQEATVQLAPKGYAATRIWSYDGTLPGPVIRAGQGSHLRRRLINALPVPTSVHWHGIRIDNAMDGVAGLTQQAVPPGGSFDYAFDLPDAGTFWYHAHTRSMEQVARGLSGALIVEEATPPDVDRDEVLLIDDWLLDPETGQFAGDFSNPMMQSHAGRTGNLEGINGRHDFTLSARQNERMRLRLINGANARIFALRLDGLRGWTVALDGMPLPGVQPVTGPIVLAPGQRADLIVDVTAAEGSPAGLLFAVGDGWRALAEIAVTGRIARTPRAAPPPLPPNREAPLNGLADAPLREMRIEGGAMRGMDGARFQGRDMGWDELVRNGRFWALAGQVGLGEAPFASVSQGETLRIRLANDTAFPHAMHLHGMHFRTLAADGTHGPLRDTVLVGAGEAAEIAFVADNPGKWLLHCHMLGHAASGMTSWIRVA